MNIEEGFALYLQGLGLLTYDPTSGTGDTFMYTMPDDPEAAVALSVAGGDKPEVKHPYDRPVLQVRVRAGEDPRVAKARSWDIYNELQDLHSLTLPGGIWLLACSAQTTPYPMGQDANHRWEFVTNYQLDIYHPTTNRT